MFDLAPKYFFIDSENVKKVNVFLFFWLKKLNKSLTVNK